MGLWEFLQQWRGGRAAAGIAASILLHLFVILALFWGGRLPIAERWKAKPGDALIVELPKPDESPAPGSPDVPASRPGPPAPPAPPRAAPAPPAPPAPPVARPQPPAPPRVAAAPRPAEPAPARPAPPAPPVRPSEAPGPAQRAPEPPAESIADKGPAAPEASSTPKVERVPPGAPAAPSNPQVASVPPGGGGSPGSLDMRSALRRGAGGRGQGWAGIEGEPIKLDSIDPEFGAFLQQVKRQIQAKWGYPCLKNPVTHGCDYYNARLYVVFGIHKSGRLQVVEVQTSSGYEIYDDYAVNAVRLAAPYPPVPPAMLAKFKSTNTGVPIMAQFTYTVETTLGTLLQ